MRLLKRLLISLLALLMLAITAIYLIPLEVYVPEAERVLSEQLHEPVSIRQLRIVALPLPHLELQEVSLGGDQGIAARSVRVEPDLPALLTGEVVVRRILVQEGTASFAKVRKLAELFGSIPLGAQSVAVREVQLTGMSLLVPGITLGPIEGKLEFARTGELERMWFAMNEQRVTATLLPLPERRFSVGVQARNWTLPQFSQVPLESLLIEGTLGEQDFIAQKFSGTLRGIRLAGSGRMEFSEDWRIQVTLSQVEAPLDQVMALLERPVELSGSVFAKGMLASKAATLGGLKDNFHFSGEVQVRQATVHLAAGLPHPLVFDQIRARVAMQPEHLELNALEAKLYNGKLSGAARIDRKGAMLTAEVAVNGIAMRPLVEALTNEVLFTGGMNGAAKFSMQLDAFERFPANLQLDGNFHLHDGMLTKVDLAQAASGSGKSNATGTTRFDDLTGLLTVDATGYHFRKLKITSGSLNAEGRVDISPSLQLGGVLDTQVKGTAGLVSMPMVISGTLDAPVVRPSGSALAGAAVGTAILGPGLGTAVGIKIGGFLSRLFGKDNDKEKDSKDAAPKPSPAK